ncbi:MAG: hypothetical protein VB858_09760 [Planctomycetaceae bacterium]
MKIHAGRQMIIRSQRSNRPGYTLIEMIIASVLVVALMSVSWSLLSLYNGFLTAGRERAATRQLARSLLSILSDDLRHVAVPVRESVPVRQQTALSAGSDDSSVPRSEVPEMPPAYAPIREFTMTGTLELIGQAGSIRLTRRRLSGVDPPIDRPSEPVETNEFTEGPGSLAIVQPGMAEIVTVVYQFEAPHFEEADGTRLAGGVHRVEVESRQWLRAEQQRDNRFQAPFSSPQLDGDLLQFLYSGPAAGLSVPGDEWSETAGAGEDRGRNTVASGRVLQHEHIPEVVHCQFSYFDGTAWLATWNSRIRSAFPTAVQVEFSLLSAGDLQNISESLHTGQFDDLDPVSGPETLNPLAPPGTGGDERREQFPAAPFPAVQPRAFRRVVLLTPGTVHRNWTEQGQPVTFRELSEGRLVP